MESFIGFISCLCFIFSIIVLVKWWIMTNHVKQLVGKLDELKKQNREIADLLQDIRDGLSGKKPNRAEDVRHEAGLLSLSESEKKIVSSVLESISGHQRDAH
jgi:hypothetical protein